MSDTPVTEPQPAAVRRLTRTRDGRWFGGVCAGLGAYFDVSPTIYRIVFAALALAGGTGILLYLAAWAVIPDEGAEVSSAERALRDHRDRPGFLIGIGLLGFAAIVLLAHEAVWPHPGNLWLAALVVGAGLVWWELHGERDRPAAAPAPGPDGAEPAGDVAAPAAPRPRRPSLFLPVLGVLLAAAGLLGLLAALDVGGIDLRVVLAAMVLFVAAAVVLGAAAGHRVAGLVGIDILLLAALIPALALHVPLRGGVGDHTYRPALAAALPGSYRLALGDLVVDLRDVRVEGGTRELDVTLGVGQLRIYVPQGVRVEARGQAHAGRVELFGHETDGLGVDETRTAGAGPGRLVIHAEVGAGNVEVRG